MTEKQDVAGKSSSSSRKSAKPPAKSPAAPIRMIVRRGALKRYDDLKKKTAHLQVESLPPAQTPVSSLFADESEDETKLLEKEER